MGYWGSVGSAPVMLEVEDLAQVEAHAARIADAVKSALGISRDVDRVSAKGN